MDLGVIVAGGAGTRLGAGVPKARAVLAGETLLERAIRILAAVCDPIVTVTPRDRRPADVVTASDVGWIEDAPDGGGPLSGIVAGLAAEDYRRAIVLGVDFPFVRPSFLRTLLAELDASGAAAVIPAPSGIPQPLVAAFAPRAAEVFAAAHARGERSPSRAMMALDPRLLTDDFLMTLDGGLENLMNLNTPEDLAAAERTLASRNAARAARRRSGS
jgi:molybdopterin-guanine dinucleotide biosynthesis protein A